MKKNNVFLFYISIISLLKSTSYHVVKVEDPSDSFYERAKNSMYREKYVAVIDAYYSTGSHIKRYVSKYGYQTLCVLSTNSIPSYLLVSYEEYKKNNNDLIILFDNKKEKIKMLKDIQILAVLAGTETGVELSDKLSYMLGLPGNNPSSSIIRRNKYYMVDRCRKAGLQTANQFLSDSIREVIFWCKKNIGSNYPVVVKPVDSSGTDGVTFCYNKKEIVKAFNRVKNKTNLLGILNSKVLVQTFLRGDEYVVNTVSCMSVHYVTDIWRCSKKRVKGAGYIHGSDELIDPLANPIIFRKLKNYAFKALKALEVDYGAGHFEMMYNNEEGPRIIEMAARLSGGINPVANDTFLEKQQINALLDAYLRPNDFFSYSSKKYVMKKKCLFVALISEKEGVLSSIPFEKSVRNLESLFSCHVRLKPGDTISKTIDIPTSPGNLYLIHDNMQVLKKDEKMVRKFEKEGFITKEDKLSAKL